MLTAIYAECHNLPFMLNVIMLGVIMLSVVVPYLILCLSKLNSLVHLSQIPSFRVLVKQWPEMSNIFVLNATTKLS
jgi:hypothetical protein